jgi:hypothetical protein
MKPIPRFLLMYACFVTAVACAQFAFNSMAPVRFQHPMAWLIFGVIAGITLIMHIYLLRAAGKEPKSFVRAFMGVNTAKIFLYLGFLVIYVMTDRLRAASFIGHFGAYYFIFTAFETTLLYRYLLPRK